MSSNRWFLKCNAKLAFANRCVDVDVGACVQHVLQMYFWDIYLNAPFEKPFGSVCSNFLLIAPSNILSYTSHFNLLLNVRVKPIVCNSMLTFPFKDPLGHFFEHVISKVSIKRSFQNLMLTLHLIIIFYISFPKVHLQCNVGPVSLLS